MTDLKRLAIWRVLPAILLVMNLLVTLYKAESGGLRQIVPRSRIAGSPSQEAAAGNE
jgi:hypothetical protein